MNSYLQRNNRLPAQYVKRLSTRLYNMLYISRPLRAVVDRAFEISGYFIQGVIDSRTQVDHTRRLGPHRRNVSRHNIRYVSKIPCLFAVPRNRNKPVFPL